MAVPKIFGNSVIYTGVTILQRCVAFFLLPIYTAYLTPADYGITGVVTSVSSLLAIFTTLGLDAAGGRFYYKYNGDPVYSRKLYGTISIIIILNSLFFGGIFILAHKWIVDPMLGNVDFYPYVLVGLLNVMVTPLYLLFQGYLQTIQNGVKYGINAMLNFLLQIGLTILLVVVFRMGALGVLLSSLITAIVFFIYVVFAFLRQQQIGIDKQIAKESFQYSLPLLPHTLANWSNGTIDRLLVNGIRSEADAGLYNLGRSYSSVINTLSIAVNSAYVPWFFDKANNIEQTLPQVRRMSEMITWVVSFLCMVMALFSQEVLDIMISNPAYDGVWKVIPFLICSTIFNSIYFFYVNVLFLKNTGVIFTITVTTIALNVGLNLLLIPMYGFIGCGLAAMFTYLLKSLLAVFVSMRKNKVIRFRTGYLFMIGMVSSAICISALLFENVNVFVSLCIKTAILCTFALVIYMTYKTEIGDLVHSIRIKK
mgnify:CR=1 FL=1